MRTNVLELEVCRIGLDVDHVLLHRARIGRASAIRAPNRVHVRERRVHLRVLIDRDAGSSTTGTASTAEVRLEDQRLLLGLGVQFLTESAIPAHIANHGPLPRAQKQIITALRTITHRTDLLKLGDV